MLLIFQIEKNLSKMADVPCVHLEMNEGRKNTRFDPYEKCERVEWELDMRNQMEWDKNMEFPIFEMGLVKCIC